MKTGHAVPCVKVHRGNSIHDLLAVHPAAFRALVSRGALLCAAVFLATGCGDSNTDSSTSTDSGGASLGGSPGSGGAGAASGGVAPVGGAGGTTATGGSATGGIATGGTASGGTATGGIATGGIATGGGTAGIGGAPPMTGGTSFGGTLTGGAPTGGVDVPTGGVEATGGIPASGGASAGGSGGAGEGGAATGGTAGGAESGGSGTGGVVSEDATFVPDPGWACGMADGIPSPTQGELAFTITLDISATHDVGNTPYGHRRLLDVSGGTITGDRLTGSVETRGLEYELTLANGVVEYQGINILKTGDGSRIFVRSCGVAPDEGSTPRVIPDFEATTSGSYAFLNTGKYVATRVATAGKIQLDVYDVSGVTAGEPRVQITKPDGVPAQPWECNTTTGSRGAEVFTESVSLGGSFSIANAKYGSRNVIPITGGTTTGRVQGAILDGGADYQLSGSLDAWYTLAPSNGELILVRNCGPMGKLIPWFEARTDGEYNFLNANTFISSDPGVSGGGVSITFYERK
jgi:hypothetical protein